MTNPGWEYAHSSLECKQCKMKTWEKPPKGAPYDPDTTHRGFFDQALITVEKMTFRVRSCPNCGLVSEISRTDSYKSAVYDDDGVAHTWEEARRLGYGAGLWED